MPQQFVIGGGDFEMWSQEFRVTTPLDLPVHGTAGVFLQRQMHNIWQLYTMPGYGFTSVYGGNPNGFGYTAPMTLDSRIPECHLAHRRAARRPRPRGVRAGDLGHHPAAVAHRRGALLQVRQLAARLLRIQSSGATRATGVAACFEPAIVKYSPCTDLDARTSDTGHVPRVNVTYKFTPSMMVYATYSKGFRPGGVNRSAGMSRTAADFLKNYEVGWKTQWLGNTLRWNGAFFWEDWNDFQFSFLGANSVTIIRNGGNARIKGVETSVDWLPMCNLLLSANFTFLDPVLTQNYYGCVPGTPECHRQLPARADGPAPEHEPAGHAEIQRQPRRALFPGAQGNWKPYAQLSAMYQSQTAPVLLSAQDAVSATCRLTRW